VPVVWLSIAVHVACIILTVVACWWQVYQAVVSSMSLFDEQVCSRWRRDSQPGSNFCSNDCPCFNCKALMWLRASVASTEAGMREGSELGRGASARSAMVRATQQRTVLRKHDACDQMHVRERVILQHG